MQRQCQRQWWRRETPWWFGERKKQMRTAVARMQSSSASAWHPARAPVPVTAVLGGQIVPPHHQQIVGDATLTPNSSNQLTTLMQTVLTQSLHYRNSTLINMALMPYLY